MRDADCPCGVRGLGVAQARLGRKAAIHCASCGSEATPRYPAGIIVLVPGGGYYHMIRSETGYEHVTVCGKDEDDFDCRIGTKGVDLCEDDFRHEWLRNTEPCPECFENVW